MKYCCKCGQQLPDQAMFCSKCGAKQPSMEAENNSAPAPAPASKEVKEQPVQKGKTDFSNFLKLRVFGLWAGIALVFLIFNLITGICGFLSSITIIAQMLVSAFAIALCIINFVKRLNRKQFNYETFTAISLAALCFVSLICGLIFVSVG